MTRATWPSSNAPKNTQNFNIFVCSNLHLNISIYLVFHLAYAPSALVSNRRFHFYQQFFLLLSYASSWNFNSFSVSEFPFVSRGPRIGRRKKQIMIQWQYFILNPIIKWKKKKQFCPFEFNSSAVCSSQLMWKQCVKLLIIILCFFSVEIIIEKWMRVTIASYMNIKNNHLDPVDIIN